MQTKIIDQAYAKFAEDQGEYLDNLTRLLQTEIEQNNQLLDAIYPKLRDSIKEMSELLTDIQNNCCLKVEDQKVDSKTLMIHNQFICHRHYLNDLHFIKQVTGKTKANMALKGGHPLRKYFREQFILQ